MRWHKAFPGSEYVEMYTFGNAKKQDMPPYFSDSRLVPFSICKTALTTLSFSLFFVHFCLFILQTEVLAKFFTVHYVISMLKILATRPTPITFL